MVTKTLFVGIDKYRPKDTQFRNLQGCVNDMHLMRTTLLDLLGGEPPEIVVLENQEATTANLTAAFEHICKTLKSEQQGFIYWAGHGGQVPNTDRSEQDPEDYDETLVPHDFSKTEPFLDDMVRLFLGQIPAGAKIVIVLDTCHSGGMPRAALSFEEARRYQQEGWENRSIGQISRAQYSPEELKNLRKFKEQLRVEEIEQNFVMLAAAQPDEYAWERYFGGEKHGIFTYHICERLLEKGLDVTPMDLIDYSFSKISLYRNNQMPRLIGLEAYFRSNVLTK